MLILTRRLGQIVRIGEEVKVTIVAIKGNHVRVGFEAPRAVPVDREELFLRKRKGLRRTGAAPGRVLLKV